ncbi:MAG TPA: hypothetical protein VEA80_12330 [Vitreimonas sp.]|uniref:hypothetical protein n=1 Tax=Vitreimonas sp. TaxID=3069702 RepID=UPI002D378BC1|nr:hypothetical protein [Vitreimonas sp.]HYD88258.1 hypothetical protein [Vitreimonas sp.]
MITEKDRRHAELSAGFFSQLAVALVAGAFLQMFLPELGSPAGVAAMLMTGLFVYGVSHVIVDLAFRTP